MDTKSIAARTGAMLLSGALLGAAMLAGCSQKNSEMKAEEAAYVPLAVMAKVSKPGSGGGDSDKADLGVLLAYEHRVQIRLPGERIAAQAAAVQSACSSGKFGACAVLGMTQSGGDDPSAMLQVRIVPGGVEPLIGVAGKGDEISERSIQADDLATAVRDNAMLQDRLSKEHARLLEFQDRKDLKIADVLTLSNRIAEIESQLQGAQQEAAQQQRRISTQLVTLNFQTTRSQESRSEIGEALRDFGGIVAAVIAFLIRAFAVLLPVSIVGGIGLWLLLKLWRARKRRKAAAG
jgi:outer membrane murein-binding lipoprotein Lpp